MDPKLNGITRSRIEIPIEIFNWVTIRLLSLRDRIKLRGPQYQERQDKLTDQFAYLNLNLNLNLNLKVNVNLRLKAKVKVKEQYWTRARFLSS